MLLRYVVFACACGLMLQACSSKDKFVGDAAAGKVLAEKGQNGANACIACHGAKGEGMQPSFPRLAGLAPKYIYKQLQDFARELPNEGAVIEPIARDYDKTPRVYSDKSVFTPGVRQDPIMTQIAKQLSDADKKNLAAYYASLGFEAKPVPAEHEALERGQDLALRGKPEYDLPACVSCHAPDGEGFGDDFPPLAGQPAQYIVEQINRWQSGQRDNDPMRMMKVVADQLTDADKLNVATYYANRSLKVKGR